MENSDKKPILNGQSPTGGLAPLSGNFIYRDVVYYYDLGDHRTATPMDIETARWLGERMEKLGYRTELSSFPAPQFIFEHSYLKIGEAPLPAFPLWYPCATPIEPLRAPLALFVEGKTDGSSISGKIALICHPYDPVASVYPGSPLEMLLKKLLGLKVLGIVIVTEGPANTIIAQNALFAFEPWPVPIVQVSPNQRDFLNLAAEIGAEAEILIRGEYELQAKGYNVVATLEGEGKPIIVSTPYSGWFGCAGERGAGVAIWLSLAHWVAEKKQRRKYVFTAVSGHELGALGMRSYLKEKAPPPSEIHCWLNLGAGFAVRSFAFDTGPIVRLEPQPGSRVFSATPGLTGLLNPIATEMPGVNSIVNNPGGELLLLARQNYCAFGMYGFPPSFYHHTPLDMPDTVTSPHILEPVAKSLARALEIVEGSAFKSL